MDLFDVDAAEREESELDRIVEKRAREARDAAAVEEAWKQSERAHRHRLVGRWDGEGLTSGNAPLGGGGKCRWLNARE